MSSFTLTPQQQQADDAARDGARQIVLVAGAGAGKTSTLVHLAKTYADLGLTVAYVCYNASTAQEARQRFPKNTTCGTAHSFAMKASFVKGEPYWAHRMRSRRNGRGFQNAKVVAKILDVTNPIYAGGKAIAPTSVATLALRTVKAFCKTDDPRLDVGHVPVPAWIDGQYHGDVAAAVLPVAERAWEDLRLRNGLADDRSAEGCLNVEHDHYLKRWQLSGRAIIVRGEGGQEVPADVVMFDEGQDANPVMAAIFKQQEAHGARLVIVGDRNQAINGWNGAIDIMGDFPDGVLIELTRSFRFGPAVAAEANKFLTLLCSTLRIEGHDPVQSVVGPMDDPTAILCRTNAGAMTAALQAHEAGRKVHLVGDGEEIKAIAQAAIDLDTKGKTFHQDLRDFVSWGQVVTYCEQGELGSEDLETSVNLIVEFGADVVIEAISKLVSDRAADVTICTAHKSKGLEWDRVQIGPDFKAPRPVERGGKPVLPSEDELMLSYVAVTRAKLALDLGSLAWVNEWVSTTPAVVPAPRETTTAAPEVGPGPSPSDEATAAQARVDAAVGGLARAVALLALTEAETRDGGYRDDADRAVRVREIVEAYLEQDTPAALAAPRHDDPDLWTGRDAARFAESALRDDLLRGA